jgi:hypothetical protein
LLRLKDPKEAREVLAADQAVAEAAMGVAEVADLPEAVEIRPHR